MHVKSLLYYPVKSCSGINLTSAKIGLRGFENDRIFMIVGDDRTFFTQRKHPKMALIKTEMRAGILTLRSKFKSEIKIKFRESGETKVISVWNDACETVDQGDEVAAWLSNFLEVECRLVMMEKNFQRILDPGYAINSSNRTGFADGYPFLLLSTASLDDLNSRLDAPIPMGRFRPNIVIEGCDSFAEDTWQQIKIGNILFEIVKPCVRCVITTINQHTLEKSKEPLATLAKYRMSKSFGGVTFGQNLIHHSTGKIKVGDKVSIIKLK